MNWNQDEIATVLNEINKRAASDADFRKLCIEKPNEAIRMVSGNVVPEGVKIKIIENSPGYDYTHVLPDFTGGELSEDEISKVAGGLCPNFGGEQGYQFPG